jgi:hypothetical protein
LSISSDNIGFDSNGTLKIFDMGLAKALSEEDRLENGLYQLTGLTGGIRYMAPEGKPSIILPHLSFQFFERSPI